MMRSVCARADAARRRSWTSAVAAAVALIGLMSLTGPPVAKLRRFSLPAGMSVLLPADFQVMPDDAIATKYPAPRKPLAAYTSPSGQVDFVVSQKSTPFKASDLPMLLRFFKASILNAFDNNVQFSQERTVTINGTEFIALEFVSNAGAGGADSKAPTAAPAPPRPAARRGTARRYTYLLYTIQAPKTEKELPQLLTLTFACPVVLADTWKPVAQEVMASVKVK